MIAIFLFYNFSSGVQSFLAFSREFRHCNVILYDGDAYLNVEFDSTGIIIRRLRNVLHGTKLLKGLKRIKYLTAMVTVDVKERKAAPWRPLWGRSCNELDRYLTGVDIGFTFNPRHLYAKLLRYNGKRNYEILTHWRRNGHIY